jgi:hypothetical protein
MGDNLAKLATLTELHEKGVINDKDYEKRKKKLLKRKWPLWIRIPLGLIGVFVLITIVVGIIPVGTPKPSTPAQLSDVPLCDSSDTQSALSNAVKNNANANQQTLSLLSLTNQTQVGTINSPPERDCTATAYFNDGQHNLSYKIFFPNPNSASNWLVQITAEN